MHVQEWNPSDVLDKTVDEVALAKPVLEECEPDITGDGKNDRAGKPDLETVQVVSVDFDTPTEEQVVHHGEDSRCGQTI
jgi:hypothetical protein